MITDEQEKSSNAELLSPNQAKYGLVLADGEYVADCFDYDCYTSIDSKKQHATTEMTVLVTNKRLVHMKFSDSKKKVSKRNVEIPIDRIESVSSYFKSVKCYSVWAIVLLSVLAVACLALGALSMAKIIPTVIGATSDAIIIFSLSGLAIIGLVLCIIFAKYRVRFGITVYTKDRPDLPCHVMSTGRNVAVFDDLLSREDNCYTADYNEIEKMAKVLSNEIMQIKIENEAEGF